MKNRSIVIVTGLLLAASWTLAHAGPAEVAAALPNKQSECRYLLGICKRAASSADPVKAIVAMTEAGQAAQVIRAKHEEMPRCFRQCVDADGKVLLNLERFK